MDKAVFKEMCSSVVGGVGYEALIASLKRWSEYRPETPVNNEQGPPMIPAQPEKENQSHG